MNMKQIQIRLSKRQTDYIEKNRNKAGINMSEQVRRMLDDYFEIKGIK